VIKPQNPQGRVRRANDEPSTTKDKGKKKAPNPPTSDEDDQPHVAKPVTPPPQVDSGILYISLCLFIKLILIVFRYTNADSSWPWFIS